jgi:hypothetical protein
MLHKVLDAGKAIADDYKAILNAVKDFYETEARLFATLLTIIAAVGGAIGWKSVADLKKEVREEYQRREGST